LSRPVKLTWRPKGGAAPNWKPCPFSPCLPLEPPLLLLILQFNPCGKRSWPRVCSCVGVIILDMIHRYIATVAQWRSQKLCVQGADLSAGGARVKASSGVGYAKGCPLRSRLGGLGMRRSSPSGVRGKRIFYIFWATERFS